MPDVIVVVLSHVVDVGVELIPRPGQDLPPRHHLSAPRKSIQQQLYHSTHSPECAQSHLAQLRILLSPFLITKVTFLQFSHQSQSHTNIFFKSHMADAGAHFQNAFTQLRAKEQP